MIDETRDWLHFMLRETPPWYGSLHRTIFARNVQASNSIEGHNVGLDDVVAAIDGSPSVEASKTSWDAVRNYRDAMAYVIQLANDPHFEYSAAVIKSLHFMVMKHDSSASPGLFRPGEALPRSRGEGKNLHHDPDIEMVSSLVQRLELSDIADDNPSIVQAGMAHINMIMIHPFKDGNGRIARALQTLVLARQRMLAPQFSSIEEYLGRNTRAYYNALAEVFVSRSNLENDARPWIRFVLVAHYRQGLVLSRRIRESERLWEVIDAERERDGLNKRTMGSLYNAAIGLQVRRPDHAEYADVSERVATSDLKKMVDVGLLRTVGERRGRHYVASKQLRRLRRRLQETHTPIPDPFEQIARTSK